MRYLIFAGQCYYGAGGSNDFLCAYESGDEAKLYAESIIGKEAVIEEAEEDWDWEQTRDIEWSQVFDVSERKTIARYGGTPLGGNETIKFLR